MQLQGKAIRITIHIGEGDTIQGKALYMALLQFLKREGASGATVTRGIAGFGARSRIHTANIMTLSDDLPLQLVWVDQVEVVERLLPAIRKMVDSGLILREEIDVVQYAPGRHADPLSQPVRNIMRTEVVTTTSDAPIADVVTLLLQRGYRSLPVVNKHGQPLGMITDGDLLRQAGLMTRLDLQMVLDGEQLDDQLNALQERSETAVDIMTQPVLTVSANNTLSQAMSKMVENNLKRLPVVNVDEKLAGWISRVDILRTLEYHQPVATEADEAIETGQQVIDLMYIDVPRVAPSAKLEEILQALERTKRRRAVVVDANERVVGIITDGDLIRRMQSASFPGLADRLRALLTGQLAAPVNLPDVTETAVDLMSSPVITVTTQTPLTEALRLMLKFQVKRLPVVDENGRFVGLLGRASLLRGILPT
ncbi:MAG: CBS domain-containing protein [Chloroflexi bacterium]|nr:CBS domain-containing protein [Chloroflexota bacterium]